ncbi:hypothetical protein HMPREF0072_1514 [Anaerococcus lactolyticus ATCC 51172]|uniref:Uncharacterized protein n=1 Tax=Anaerococcus lactolyticus ATCC 51172 TaxID=525254 RepID=C2BGP4_9FIRM|nr:hypothetical protein HMPREF0072_1514 [Anaerococcus lactolyticus ATCC 51172]
MTKFSFSYYSPLYFLSVSLKISARIFSQKGLRLAFRAGGPAAYRVGVLWDIPSGPSYKWFDLLCLRAFALCALLLALA